MSPNLYPLTKERALQNLYKRFDTHTQNTSHFLLGKNMNLKTPKKELSKIPRKDLTIPRKALKQIAKDLSKTPRKELLC